MPDPTLPIDPRPYGVSGIVFASAPLSYDPITKTVSISLGSLAGTACAGDDSRLSDTREPTEHADTHGADGSDPICIESSQITDLEDAILGGEGGPFWTRSSRPFWS